MLIIQQSVEGELLIDNDHVKGLEGAILPKDHNYSDGIKPKNYQGIFLSKDSTHDDVRMGVRTIILLMLSIGRDSLMGAGSIVRKNRSLPSLFGGDFGIIKERGVSL